MNWKPSLAVLLGLLLTSSAVWSKDNYVMSADKQQPVYPQNRFDARVTESMLEPGTFTLKGTAYLPANGKKPKQYPMPGTRILLFPYTAYCEEVVTLLKKYEIQQPEQSEATMRAERELIALTGRGIPPLLPVKRVELDPMFATLFLSTTVLDEQGTFVFENLKPGKYYLQSDTLYVERLATSIEEVGQIEKTTTNVKTGDSWTDTVGIYQKDMDFVYRKTMLRQVVDLTEDLEVEFNQR